MNTKQLDAIDALVAECVFGWRWLHVESADYDGKKVPHDVLVSPQIGSVDELLKMYPPRGTLAPLALLRASYTRSWAAAGEVVEKMRLSLLAITGTDGSPLWQARRWVSTQDDCSTNHEDPRVAVCMAALRAVGAGDRLDAAIKENA
jgi:hypothetical protein